MSYIPIIQNGEIEQFGYSDDRGIDFFEVLRAAKGRAEATGCDQMVCTTGGRVLCVYRVGRINRSGEYCRGRFYYTLEGSQLCERLRSLEEKKQ